MPFLAIRAIVADIAEAEELIDRVQAAARARLSIPGSLIVVAHDDFLETDSLDLEIGYARGDPPSLDLNDGRRLTMGTLPGVARMLSTVCVATQEDGHRRAHHAIGAWLSRHGCRLDGPGREILHPHAGDDRVATIEIQYPIIEVSVRGPR